MPNFFLRFSHEFVSCAYSPSTLDVLKLFACSLGTFSDDFDDLNDLVFPPPNMNNRSSINGVWKILIIYRKTLKRAVIQITGLRKMLKLIITTHAELLSLHASVFVRHCSFYGRPPSLVISSLI
jgi:hypothetical protein